MRSTYAAGPKKISTLSDAAPHSVQSLHTLPASLGTDPGFMSSTQRVCEDPSENPNTDLHAQEPRVHLCSQQMPGPTLGVNT